MIKKLPLLLIFATAFGTTVSAQVLQVRSLAPGEMALIYHTDKYYWPAKIVSYNDAQNTVNIEWFSGSKATIKEEQLFYFVWRKGYQIQCKWEKDNAFYDVTVEKIEKGTAYFKWKSTGNSSSASLNSCKANNYYQQGEPKQISDIDSFSSMVKNLLELYRFNDALWLAKKGVEYGAAFYKENVNASFYLGGYVQVLQHVYRIMGDFDKSIELFKQYKSHIYAYAVYDMYATFESVTAIFNKGLEFIAIGDYQMALKYMAEAERVYNERSFGNEGNPFQKFYNGNTFFHSYQWVKKKIANNYKPKVVHKLLSINYPKVYTKLASTAPTSYFGPLYRRVKLYTWQPFDYKMLKLHQAHMKLAYEVMSQGKITLEFINKDLLIPLNFNVTGLHQNLEIPAVKSLRDSLLKQFPDIQTSVDMFPAMFDYWVDYYGGYYPDAHSGLTNFVMFSPPHKAQGWVYIHEFFHSIELHIPTQYPLHGWASGSLLGWQGDGYDEISFFTYSFQHNIKAKADELARKYNDDGWKLLFQTKWPKEYVKGYIND